MKILAGRPKDQEDVHAMLAAQGDRLDFGGDTYPWHVCAPENGELVSAAGTTKAQIYRVGDTWYLQSEPSGSIGRLFDTTDPHNPIDKGRYNFSFFVTFTKKKGR